MAKGWRLYREYERQDFGDAVKDILDPMNLGTCWLSHQTGVHKGTISQILSGRRSCHLGYRRRIAEAIAPLVERGGQGIAFERLLRAAGLVTDRGKMTFSGSGGAHRTSLPPDRLAPGAVGDNSGATDSIRAVTEGLRFRYELGQVMLAEQRFESASRARDVPRLSARAMLNVAYIDFEIDELDLATVRARSALSSAREIGLWPLAAEAAQLLGRIALRRERCDEARAEFTRSDSFLKQLTPDLSQLRMGWPRNLLRVGHSFVIAPDVDLPPLVLHAGNLHFLGRTDLFEVGQPGISRNHQETLLTRGIRHFERAEALDRESSAGAHVGFDLVFQAQLLTDSCRFEDAKHKLDESRSYLGLGAGRRIWFLTRSQWASSNDVPLRRVKHDVEVVQDALGWSPSPVGEFYDSQRSMYWQYRPKLWKMSALRYGFAAAVVRPCTTYLQRFGETVVALKEDLGVRGANHVLKELSEELLNCEGDFAPIGKLVQHLGTAQLETIARNMNEVLANDC